MRLSAIWKNSTGNWLLVYAILAFFVGFCASAFAAVPYRAKEVAVDENFQYVDRELKQKLDKSGGEVSGALTLSSVTVSGYSSFSSESSTVTFSGWVDIGLETISQTGDCGLTWITATCTAGKKVLGGGVLPGTSGGVYVRGSYPNTTASWSGRADCTSAAGSVVVYAICARIK